MHLYNFPFSPKLKLAGLLLADAALLTMALSLSFSLLGDDFGSQNQLVYTYLAMAVACSLLVFMRMGVYRALILYLGMQFAFQLLKVVTFATCLVAAACILSLPPEALDYSLFPIFWMLALLLTGGSRFLVKVMTEALIQNFRPKEPVIIYGAGSSGMQLLVALQNGDQYLPVAFVDDSHRMIGSTVNGIRVYSPNALYELIETYSARQILLAIPSATHAERREIINRLEHLPVHVKTVPDLFDMVSGKVEVHEVREIDIEDLLGREIVPPSQRLLGACVSGKSVLVTGAGGSIGSELCRQIISAAPSRLVLLDSSEFGLYETEKDLRTRLEGRDGGGAFEIVALLGSVCNRRHMDNLIETFGVETVYHAAAYKQVPMVEKNIFEGVANNVFGTLTAARAARKFGVRNFVLISTDKAVRPTNYMGATKRLAEQALQAMAHEQESEGIGETRFSMVRFGNVLGSSGSVVPLFRQQIAGGGPVTVTHPEVTRYFMTVQEAAQLVIQAGSMATGGDVFVLDMHKPIQIVELARKMIHLMGYDVRDPNTCRGDIAIKYTGLRPGEKLHEELMTGKSVTGTEHPKIMRAEEGSLTWERLQPMLDRLDRACAGFDLDEIQQVLKEAVDGFDPKGEALDPLSSIRSIPRRDEADTTQENVTRLFNQ